jgi:hypothetical protein
MVQDRVGADALCEAAVITDSANDWDLLSQCAHPMLVTWPQARYEPAPRGYAPFAYTELQKRPGDQYVRHIVLQRDLVIWILATVFVTDLPVARHVAGLACLLLSFWCIYELGYVENDRMGQRYEDEPVLAEGYAGPPAGIELTAWLWALATAAAAVVLLRPGSFVAGLAAWLAFLVGTRAVYAVYNRLDKAARPLLYVALQALRMAAPLVLVPVSVVGATALLVIVWSRSVLYVLYRAVGGPWRDVSLDLYNAAFLAIGVAAMAVAGARVRPLETAVLLAWFLLIARGEARRALLTFRPVWRHAAPADDGAPPRPTALAE